MRGQKATAHLIEKRRCERGRGGDPQVAAQFMLQLLHVFGGQLQLHQRLACAFQVDAARFGQRHAPGGAVEQARAEFFLQLGHGLGQGRRGFAEQVGGAAEITLFGGGDEHGQGTHFVHLSIPDRHRSCAGAGIQFSIRLG
ncbi:hypothetical protein D3C73_532160 [compost metagenome]